MPSAPFLFAVVLDFRLQETNRRTREDAPICWLVLTQTVVGAASGSS